jgi:uncharacterized membrane protein/glutaredoxin
LSEIPLPFIAYLSNRNYAVVTRKDKDLVTLSNEGWNNKAFTADEFKKLYGGSVLIAEKATTSGEADFIVKRRKELIANWLAPTAFAGLFIMMVAFLLLNSSYLTTLTLQTGFLTFFKTAGLTTAVLLLLQSIDANNPLIQKLCGSDNNKDCNAILSSKAAKIGGIGWSEIGFFYFAGTWLALLFNSNHRALMQVLAALSLVSLPYTFYSIYYQWQVAKQWCKFCCVVQAILWLEFFAFLPYLINFKLQIPDSVEWGNLLMCMTIPALAWAIVKPYLLQAQQIRPLKKQLRKFKYNAGTFEKMLNDEVKYALPAEEHSLVIGNREAENVITMVSNPYCQPCAKVHKTLDEWLSNRSDIKLQIVFSTQNTKKDKKTQIAAHLMALQNNRDDVSLKKALNDWYGQKQKNYEAWAKEHPSAATDSLVHEILETQKAWCKLTEITGTPTLFLNGRKLPKNYQPEDLKYFI